VRLALWTPRPDAAWIAALLPLLRREAAVEVVAGEAGRAPEADLDLYHVADDLAHVFVHHALCLRPGVVLLADWGLHRLARAATAGDAAAYLAEARRAHGERSYLICDGTIGSRALRRRRERTATGRDTLQMLHLQAFRHGGQGVGTAHGVFVL